MRIPNNRAIEAKATFAGNNGAVGPMRRPDLTRRAWRMTGSSAAWIALFGLNSLGILPWMHVKFPVVDLAEMVYEVQRIYLGYVPYKDTFTHHFLGYLIPFYALRSITPLTPLVLKVASLCFNFATAVAIWAIVREVASPPVAWLGGFLAVTMGWFWNWQGFAFNLQSYITPLLSFVLLLVTRACLRQSVTSLYACAFLSGILLTFDQRAAVFLILLAIPPLAVPELRRWRTLCVSAVLLMFVPALCGLYLWRVGAWSDFLEQTVVFPLFYRNQGIPAQGLLPALQWVGPWLWSDPLAALCLFVGLVTAWLAELRRWLLMVLATTVICAAGYVALGGRPYPNYFLIFAPVALVLMALLPWYARKWSKTAGIVTGAALVVLGAFSGAKPLMLFAQTGMAFLEPAEETVEASARFVRDHTTAEDPVLVWGFAPQIYVLSDRFHTFKDAGLLSVAGANFASTSSEDQGRIPHMVHEFEEYLVRTPPKVIVHYVLTREPTGLCYGKGVVQRNIDYRQSPHLKPLRDVITQSYRLDRVENGPCDRAEMFLYEP